LPYSRGDVLVLTLLEATAGRRGVMDEEPKRSESARAAELALVDLRGAPQHGGRDVGEVLPVAHLVDAVGRRAVALPGLRSMVFRLAMTCRMGRRRTGGGSIGEGKGEAPPRHQGGSEEGPTEGAPTAAGRRRGVPTAPGRR